MHGSRRENSRAGIDIVPHDNNANKADPNRGVKRCATSGTRALVHLPRGGQQHPARCRRRRHGLAGRGQAGRASHTLPSLTHQRRVMAQWFGEFWLPKMTPTRALPRLKRPAWLCHRHLAGAARAQECLEDDGLSSSSRATSVRNCVRAVPKVQERAGKAEHNRWVGVGAPDAYNILGILRCRPLLLRSYLADIVDFHRAAQQELDSIPAVEQAAVQHAREKLMALGDHLPYPHQSAVKGVARLRELRPRGGNSPWRPIYTRTKSRFIVLAIAPEALVDTQGYRRAVAKANERLIEIEEEDAHAKRHNRRR